MTHPTRHLTAAGMMQSVLGNFVDQVRPVLDQVPASIMKFTRIKGDVGTSWEGVSLLAEPFDEADGWVGCLDVVKHRDTHWKGERTLILSLMGDHLLHVQEKSRVVEIPVRAGDLFLFDQNLEHWLTTRNSTLPSQEGFLGLYWMIPKAHLQARVQTLVHELAEL